MSESLSDDADETLKENEEKVDENSEIVLDEEENDETLKENEENVDENNEIVLDEEENEQPEKEQIDIENAKQGNDTVDLQSCDFEELDKKNNKAGVITVKVNASNWLDQIRDFDQATIRNILNDMSESKLTALLDGIK